MIDFDVLLAQASLPEQVVPICLDGRLVRRWEEVKARVDARAEAEEQPGDQRLGRRVKADPEQAELDALAAQIQEKTTPFLVKAMPRDQFVEFVAEPRYKARVVDPKSGALDPRDATMGVNSSLFVPDLVRVSIADPDVASDDRWERLRQVLSSRQMEKLFAAAWDINREDREVPFSPPGSPRTEN